MTCKNAAAAVWAAALCLLPGVSIAKKEANQDLIAARP
jgi:hypothetical protein